MTKPECSAALLFDPFFMLARRWSKQFVSPGAVERAIWKIKEFLPAWAPEPRCDAQPYVVGFLEGARGYRGGSPPVISCDSLLLLI